MRVPSSRQSSAARRSWVLLICCLAAHAGTVPAGTTPAGETQATPCGPGQIPGGPSGCVTPPQIVRRTKPEFPRLKEGGPVDVRIVAVIGEDGAVKDARAIAPFAPRPYEEAALKAVRRWRYRPARDASGRPVRVHLEVKVSFVVG